MNIPVVLSNTQHSWILSPCCCRKILLVFPLKWSHALDCLFLSVITPCCFKFQMSFKYYSLLDILYEQMLSEIVNITLKYMYIQHTNLFSLNFLGFIFQKKHWNWKNRAMHEFRKSWNHLQFSENVHRFFSVHSLKHILKRVPVKMTSKKNKNSTRGLECQMYLYKPSNQVFVVFIACCRERIHKHVLMLCWQDVVKVFYSQLNPLRVQAAVDLCAHWRLF